MITVGIEGRCLRPGVKLEPKCRRMFGTEGCFTLLQRFGLLASANRKSYVISRVRRIANPVDMIKIVVFIEQYRKIYLRFVQSKK